MLDDCKVKNKNISGVAVQVAESITIEVISYSLKSGDLFYISFWALAFEFKIKKFSIGIVVISLKLHGRVWLCQDVKLRRILDLKKRRLRNVSKFVAYKLWQRKLLNRWVCVGAVGGGGCECG